MPKLDTMGTSSSAFNVAYLADFVKAAKAYGAKTPGIRVFTQCEKLDKGRESHGPALVRFVNFDGCHDIFAVIMPLRDETPAEYPEWILSESED